MKRKASVSHDEAIVRRIRKDPSFAAEYLKSALEDSDEPRVLLIALRHLALAQGVAKVAKAAGIERESLYRATALPRMPAMSADGTYPAAEAMRTMMARKIIAARKSV